LLTAFQQIQLGHIKFSDKFYCKTYALTPYGSKVIIYGGTVGPPSTRAMGGTLVGSYALNSVTSVPVLSSGSPQNPRIIAFGVIIRRVAQEPDAVPLNSLFLTSNSRILGRALERPSQSPRSPRI
jgi:hypothetical protein